MNGRIRAARDWVLWSPRRAIALLVGAGRVVSLVAAMTAGTVSARMAGATRPAPSPSAAAPTRDPGWLATGDPHRPSPPPAARTSPLPTRPPAAAGPDVVAREFLAVWMSAPTRPETADGLRAWREDLVVFGTPGLRAQLEFVRLTDVTAATVTGVTVDVMLGSAAATATLSDGTLLVVQMVREDGWRVRGVQSATPL